MCGITASIADTTRANGLDLSALPVNGRSNSVATNNAEYSPAYKSRLLRQLGESLVKIRHRGPDDSGVWVSDDGAIGLGHCRLAINDLTRCGRQPLVSDDGQVRAVVNGEIYDFDRLRKQCIAEHGYRFSSESDSELVVALYKIHGAPGLFEHLRGEFAFILCDHGSGEHRVIAGRDRFGIKPLFWTRTEEGRILIASEAKAFLPLGWKPQWNVKGIATMSWMYEGSLFKGVQRIPHRHYLEIKGGSAQLHRYFDTQYRDKNVAETRGVDEMILGVRERLVEAVRVRMRADVPVGVYLSGGIDSAAIAGIVNHLAAEESTSIGCQTSEKLTCFTIGFPGGGLYDESAIAKRTAEWLGVDIIELQCTEQLLADNFQRNVYHCEQHHLNLNSVAKFALSELPHRSGFKVVLTGEGSDEHFAGYPNLYQNFLDEVDAGWPYSALAQDAALVRELRHQLSKIVGGMLPGGATRKGDKVTSAAEVNDNSFIEFVVSRYSAALLLPWAQKLVAGEDSTRVFLDHLSPTVKAQIRSKWHPLHSALYMWNETILPGIILSCLGDRVEMAHSLEARTPFLDHHLTEYVNHLPPSVKVAYMAPDASAFDAPPPNAAQIAEPSGVFACLREKWILREAVRPFVTDELYRRRKHMFWAPTAWPIDGPLHCKMKEIITKEKVERLGFWSWEGCCQAMGEAFGESADNRSFEIVLATAAWVTLSEEFRIPPADEEYLR